MRGRERPPGPPQDAPDRPPRARRGRPRPRPVAACSTSGSATRASPRPTFVRQALLGAVPTASGYPSVEGTPELRQAAARYLARRFGVDSRPGHARSSPRPDRRRRSSTCRWCSSIRRTGRDRVVFGEPGYAAFRIGTTLRRRRRSTRCRSARRRSYLFGPEDVGDEVARRATAIVFLNYPHNPSGQDMPPDAVRGVGRGARRSTASCSSPTRSTCDLYVGEPPHSLLEFGREGCLAVHSLSKRSGMTGYLSGLHRRRRASSSAHCRSFRAGMGVASPVWTQAAAAAAWSDEAHVDERRGRDRARSARVLLEVARAPRPARLPRQRARSSCGSRCRTGETDVAYAERLLEAGIVVAPGSMFGPARSASSALALAPTLEACRGRSRTGLRPEAAHDAAFAKCAAAHSRIAVATLRILRSRERRVDADLEQGGLGGRSIGRRDALARGRPPASSSRPCRCTSCRRPGAAGGAAGRRGPTRRRRAGSRRRCGRRSTAGRGRASRPRALRSGSARSPARPR